MRRTEELIKALRRVEVDTGSIVCLGCGREHGCSVHGCAILREAATALEESQERSLRYAEEIMELRETLKRGAQ